MIWQIQVPPDFGRETTKTVTRGTGRFSDGVVPSSERWPVCKLLQHKFSISYRDPDVSSQKNAYTHTRRADLVIQHILNYTKPNTHFLSINTMNVKI